MTFEAALDTLILLWLIGTWFYEGHHQRCIVRVKCPRCESNVEHDCEG